ncbi:MAG TPA: thioesterase family protein, partial [Myxococcales bacterium]|nr:thioesterase family protein [Myxococcales bacterium]
MASFYTRKGEQYASSPSTVGPWDPKLQHGGPVAALLGTRIEQAAARPDCRVAQFSMQFMGPVPVADLDVTVGQVRPGKRISHWSASASARGREAVRVNAWMLSVKEGRNPLIHLQDSPPPPMPAEAISTYFEAVPHFGYGDALEWRFPEGGFKELGPATCWARLKVSLVEGEPVSPLARVLAMVDSANGISAELDV